MKKGGLDNGWITENHVLLAFYVYIANLHGDIEGKCKRTHKRYMHE